jgi:hypothetical protein
LNITNNYIYEFLISSLPKRGAASFQG